MATLFALRHDDRYLLVMHSFESELEFLSPGIVAIDEMITHLIDSGITYCDFTIGNEPYKRQFGVEEGVLYYGMCPLTTRGHIYVKTRHLLKSIKRALVPVPYGRPQLGASLDEDREEDLKLAARIQCAPTARVTRWRAMRSGGLYSSGVVIHRLYVLRLRVCRASALRPEVPICLGSLFVSVSNSARRVSNADSAAAEEGRSIGGYDRGHAA